MRKRKAYSQLASAPAIRNYMAKAAALPSSIVVNSGKNKTVLYLLLGVATIGGLYYGKKWYDNYKLEQENKKADSDDNANLASKIYAENRATWTSDDKQLELYKGITDYNAVRMSYKKAHNLDMLEDTRKHVSSGTYQQILNIIGIKGGAIKPTSQAAQNVQNSLMEYLWVVAKIDTRVRKSAKVSSAIFTTKPNIIGVAKSGAVIGIIDKQAILENKGKLYYDEQHNTFFLPVIVFDSVTVKKSYKAFVAIANVNVLKTQPTGASLFTVSAFQYNNAYST